MTIKELKKLIKDMPDDLLIVLARGTESNHASLLYRGREMMYVPHSPWQGFIFATEESETLGPQATRALVLRPM